MGLVFDTCDVKRLPTATAAGIFFTISQQPNYFYMLRIVPRPTHDPPTNLPVVQGLPGLALSWQVEGLRAVRGQ